VRAVGGEEYVRLRHRWPLVTRNHNGV